ncbi:MAG: histidinol-phosphate transaminase [Ardenticatenaceae bacterium]|nr:histidinol-phosphate transaminase [Ardenticatenaceae bacterium]
MTHSDLPFDPHIQTAPTFDRGRPMASFPSDLDPAAIVKLSANENALGCSPQVVTAVQAEAAGLALYPPGDGEQKLRSALAAMHGRSLTGDYLVLGNGGLDILDFAVRGLLRPGTELITSHPTFGFLDTAASRLGAVVKNVPLTANFDYDVAAVRAAVTEQTRIIYLCNPNNPTGNLVTIEMYEQLLDGLPDNILVISDEAYAHFAGDDFPDTTRYIHNGRNLLQLYSFSKVFGLAGLRLGYGIARPEIVTYLARLKRPFHLGRLTIAAGLAAVADQAHIRQTISTITSGRGWLTQQMAELGVQVWPSWGNFLLMAVPGFTSEEITPKLLQHGVMVTSGQRRFALPNHIRVTVGLPDQNQRFVEVMSKILRS